MRVVSASEIIVAKGGCAEVAFAAVDEDDAFLTEPDAFFAGALGDALGGMTVSLTMLRVEVAMFCSVSSVIDCK